SFGSRSGDFDTDIGLDLGNREYLDKSYNTTGLELITVVATVSVIPNSGLTTTESGGTATFAEALGAHPRKDVTIALHSSDLTQGTVSPSSVTFTPDNWNIAQTVTVTGVDNHIAGGEADYTIVTDPAVSDDQAYSGLDPTDVSVTNIFDDKAGISV